MVTIKSAMPPGGAPPPVAAQAQPVVLSASAGTPPTASAAPAQMTVQSASQPTPVASAPKPAPVATLPAVVKPTLPAASSLALPAYVQVAPEGHVAPGLENAAGNGLELPILALTQPLTPAVMSQKIRPGSVVLHSDPETVIFGMGVEANFVSFFHFREWIEWAPRNSGRGLLARSKDPKGDLSRRFAERWASTEKPDPNAPSVEEYHVFFLFFEGNLDEPVALPCSRTKHKKGRLLLSLMHRRGPRVPIYAGKYSMGVCIEQNRRSEQYYNYDFKPAGWATKEEYQAAEKQYGAVKEMYESILLSYRDDVEDEEERPAEVINTTTKQPF